MMKILIDAFIVPAENKEAFLEEVRKSARVLRAFPGYVEGWVHEKTEGESRYNVVTTAVWESEEAYLNARKTAMAEFQKIGFNPPEIMKRLNVQIERGVYSRSPY